MLSMMLMYVKNAQISLLSGKLPELIEIVGTCYVLKTLKSLRFNTKVPNDILQ